MASAERLLISAILQAEDNSIPKQEGLSPKDFIVHKPEYSFIIQNGVPSKALFRQQFPDFKFAKSQGKDIPHLVLLVRKERVKHELHKAIESVIKDVEDKNPLDLAKRLGDAMDKIQGMYSMSRDVDILNNAELLVDEFKRRVHMRKEGKQVGIPTGIPTIDTETSGLAPSELWVIVGRQGDGKTWLSLEFTASAIIHKLSVLYISLEMPPELIAFRLHTLLWALRHPKKKQNKFPNLELIRGEGSVKAYRQYLDNLRTTYKSKFIVPQLSSNFIFTTSTVAAKIEEHKPALVVIDYIGLMQSEGGKGKIENWQEIAQQIRELKTMAMHYQIPIVVNAQANRAANDENTAPKLHQIAGSDAIGANSDRVISLRMLPSKNLRISIEKNRYGRQNFTFDVKWNINHGFMRELPPKINIQED